MMGACSSHLRSIAQYWTLKDVKRVVPEENGARWTFRVRGFDQRPEAIMFTLFFALLRAPLHCDVIPFYEHVVRVAHPAAFQT